MIVVREDDRPTGAFSDPGPTPKPSPSLPNARAAERAAQAIVAGELDVEAASSRYGIAAPLLETWLRALLAAGLVRKAAPERRGNDG